MLLASQTNVEKVQAGTKGNLLFKNIEELYMD